MPCYSGIETKLTDLETVQKAAEATGITVTKRSATRYTLSKDGESIDIECKAGEKYFSTVAYSGSSNWPDAIIRPLTQQYAKERVKQFAKKRGYMVSAGSKPGQVVLTKYGK